MRVVDQPIQDGIGEGGIANEVMPVLDWDLARDQRGPSASAVVDDFEEIAAFPITERSEAPVIENDELRFRKVEQEFPVRAIGVRVNEILAQEAREPEVAHGVALAAGTLAQRAGEPGLAGAGGPGDEQHGVLANPLAAGELHHETPLEAALGAEVHVFDAGGEPKAGELQEPRQPTVFAGGLLPFEEEGEAILEAELREVGQPVLFLERLGHAEESEFLQELERLVLEHESSLNWWVKVKKDGYGLTTGIGR